MRLTTVPLTLFSFIDRLQSLAILPETWHSTRNLFLRCLLWYLISNRRCWSLEMPCFSTYFSRRFGYSGVRKLKQMRVSTSACKTFVNPISQFAIGLNFYRIGWRRRSLSSSFCLFFETCRECKRKTTLSIAEKRNTFCSRRSLMKNI